MRKESNSNLDEMVFKKVKKMNVDKRQDILGLIFLLQNNEMISHDKFCEYPINRISQSLGIAVYYANMEEDGVLFADGTTYELYGCNQVILTNKSHSLRRQREIRANLLGVYLLDYLKNFDGNHQKVYIASYNKTNMNNKARFFAKELLTPLDIFTKQYVIATEYCNDPIYTRAYLREYFNVTPNFVEDRINEIANGHLSTLESVNPNNNIVVFQRKL